MPDEIVPAVLARRRHVGPQRPWHRRGRQPPDHQRRAGRAGARLPTVRDLARQLGISPTTVSEAWRCLADVGAIDARGRRGTFVRRRRRDPRGPRRYRRVTEGPGHVLPSTSPPARPTRTCCPTSARASRRIAPPDPHHELPRRPGAARPRRGAAGALAVPARGRSPWSTGPWTPSTGSPSIVVRLGDRVLVENPCFPPAARPARTGRRRADRPPGRRATGIVPEALARSGSAAAGRRSSSSPGPRTRPA